MHKIYCKSKKKFKAFYITVLMLFGIASNNTEVIADTVSVDCSKAKISSQILSSKIGEPRTINVSGNCSESFIIPSGYIIIIKGIGSSVKYRGNSYGASISASSNLKPLATVFGKLTLENLYLTSSVESDSVVKADAGGYVTIFNSAAATSTALSTLYASTNGYIEIANSYVTNSKNSSSSSTINIILNGVVWIEAFSPGSTTITYDGGKTTSIIGCWHGNLGFWSNSGGRIYLGPSSNTGIGAFGCRASVGVNSMDEKSLVFSNIDNWLIYDHGGSYIEIANANLISKGKGITTESGVMTLKRTTLNGADNSQGIVAKAGGIIKFQDYVGKSTINGSTPYSCVQGGNVYATDTPLGTATSPGGCLKIGGSSVN